MCALWAIWEIACYFWVVVSHTYVVAVVTEMSENLNLDPVITQKVFKLALGSPYFHSMN